MMRAPSSLSRRRALVLGGAALAALSCSSSASTSGRCQTDDTCGPDAACAAGTCLPRAAPPASWNVVLVPRSDSMAALTESPAPSLPATGFDLVADPKTNLMGTLMFDANLAPPATAHLVLTVPSTIGGLPDLQFETDTAAMKAAAPTFTFAIPQGVVGRTGTLRVLPGPPDDATHAPSTFKFMVTVTTPLTLPVTSKVLTVSGRLLSALGDPLPDLVARAFQDGNLVSNVVPTTTNGFTLGIPIDAKATSIAVEVAPMAADAPAPHFWAKPFALTANVDLGDVQLPAYPQPTLFTLPFQSAASSDPPVSGALVRARTVLADDMQGITDFLRDGLTDMGGRAALSLLPGTTTVLRSYDIAVVPPADSVYATTCLEGLELGGGAVQPTVPIAKRPAFAGVVRGADGNAVSGVTIQAVRTAGATATACDEFASPPPTTGKTNMDGSFLMYLDAGTYTLDFDPPAGAPYPRLTAARVVVAATDGPREVNLPAGGILEGTMRDQSGQALPQASARFFGPTCVSPQTCPLVLEAQARADQNGLYRAVIPVAPGAISP
jgi:hypothetical protein